MSTKHNGDQRTKTQGQATLRLRLYTPHEKQRQLHEATARFVVAAFGRQSGKSTCAVNQLLKCAWEKPSTKYWFVSPTFPQSRVMYRRLVGMLWSAKDILLKKNQTELRVKLINNSEIRFVSGEVLDNLRGETLNGAIIDEVRDQHPELWTMVIRPMLATTKGWAWFISTPNGFDHFYDLAENAKIDSDWATYRAPSTANPLFTKDEYEAAKRAMSEPQFAQEILAEFRDLTAGKAYQSFGIHNLAHSCPWAEGRDWAPFHSVVVGMDFNLSPMAWTLGQTSADRWWWFDEIHLENSHTLEAAQQLRDKILGMKVAGYRAEPNLIIAGDATGKATQRTSNQSDYDIVKHVLKTAGITFSDRTPEANPSIKDRVNSVNQKCMTAAGEVELHLHPERCKALKKDLDRVVWKMGGDFILDSGPEKKLTHASDSIGYAVCSLTPIRHMASVGTTRIIQRIL